MQQQSLHFLPCIQSIIIPLHTSTRRAMAQCNDCRAGVHVIISMYVDGRASGRGCGRGRELGGREAEREELRQMQSEEGGQYWG